jgi:hypothetical protein
MVIPWVAVCNHQTAESQCGKNAYFKKILVCKAPDVL